MRIAILCLAALLLTGCRVVFVPLPVAVDGGLSLSALPSAEPVAAEPEPSAAAPATTTAEAVRATYADFAAAYAAMQEQTDVMNFADPDWCAETAKRAARWRETILAIQALTTPPPLPNGAAVWPEYQQAMSDFHYVAGAIELAAEQCKPGLMLGVAERLVTGGNHLAEALRMMGGE
mgnify:CR=1 FL=1